MYRAGEPPGPDQVTPGFLNRQKKLLVVLKKSTHSIEEEEEAKKASRIFEFAPSIQTVSYKCRQPSELVGT